MKLSPLLLKNERENAGAMASNRFSYQINWGVCQLLRLHTENSDPYYLLMEKHDDAIICDDLENPNNLEFFQIKTKKGANWKLASLISKKGSSMSILGKMYNSREKFGEITKKISFRTNAYFAIKDSNNKSYRIVDSFRFSELNDRDKLRFERAVDGDCVVKTNEDFNLIYEFKKDDLDVTNHVDTTIGKMSNFFDQILDEPFRGLAYVFIAGEVSRRNNYEGTISSTIELQRLKSVSREDFTNWLSHCVRRIKNSNETLQVLNSELMKVGETFGSRRTIQRNVREYTTKLKSGDAVTKKLQALIAQEESNVIGDTITDCADNLYNKIEDHLKFVDYLGKNKIISYIMFELCR